MIQYRGEWVARMLELEKKMSSYEGEDLKEVEPLLKEGEKKVVQVTHDECCFHAHDGMKETWLAEGEKPLRKKGEGKSFMASGFLCPCHGVVDLEFIAPGKNADGYWKSADMVAQVCFFFFFLSFFFLLPP